MMNAQQPAVPQPQQQQQQQQAAGQAQQQPQQPQQQQNTSVASSQAARQVADRIVTEFGSHFAYDETSARARGTKYYLIRIIGQGASAVVLQIRRTVDNVPFALKLVDLSAMAEADKQRARAEIDCLCSCDIFTVVKCHEEFVKFHRRSTAAPQPAAEGTNAQNEDDADFDNPRLFALVLDYANAGDLRMEIKNRARANRPFREHEAGLLFLQVLLAVHHVHSKHMIHRDIKSANVLLCTNGLLKLGDFGFSRIYHNATVSDNVGRTFCGTPYYVAPEIWRRRPYSKKADIFSIGVLLYELLTLKRPFDGNSVQDVMEKTLTARYDPLPDTISAEMRELVGMLLSDNPDTRPNTTQLLRLPIAKLFLDALMGIILTQNPFDDPLRDEIRAQVKAIRDSLTAKARLRDRLTLSNGAGTASSSQNGDSVVGASVASINDMAGLQMDQDDILCEGMLRKLSIDGSWKRRYLAIVHRKRTGADNSVNRGGTTCPPGATVANTAVTSADALQSNPPKDPPEQYDLILAVTKEGVAQQCIVTNFSELEDVFPVPFKYAGPGLQNVFAIAFKSGVKRLTFHAASPEDRQAWQVAIHQVLGLDDQE